MQEEVEQKSEREENAPDQEQQSGSNRKIGCVLDEKIRVYLCVKFESCKFSSFSVKTRQLSFQKEKE